jgi:hypothetical protein
VRSFASPTPHGPRSSPTPWGSHLSRPTNSPPHRSADQRGAVPVNPFPPPKLKYLLFGHRTVATFHMVFDSSPNTITPCIYSYLQLSKSTVSSITAYHEPTIALIRLSRLGAPRLTLGVSPELASIITAPIMAIERLKVTLWGYGAPRCNRGYPSNPHQLKHQPSPQMLGKGD